MTVFLQHPLCYKQAEGLIDTVRTDAKKNEYKFKYDFEIHKGQKQLHGYYKHENGHFYIAWTIAKTSPIYEFSVQVGQP